VSGVYLFKPFQVSGQMKKQVVVFTNGEVFGNGHNDGNVFVNHTFEITMTKIQNSNKLQKPIPEFSNDLKSNWNLDFEFWHLFVICDLFFWCFFLNRHLSFNMWVCLVI
jgi:hypothetical protein